MIRYLVGEAIRISLFSLVLVIVLLILALDLWVVLFAIQVISFSKAMIFPQPSVLGAALIGWTNVALVFFFQHAHYHANHSDNESHLEPYKSILEHRLLPIAQFGAFVSNFIAMMALMGMMRIDITNRFFMAMLIGFSYLIPLIMTVVHQLSNEKGIVIHERNYDD